MSGSVIDYRGKELSAFQLKRIIRAMSQQHTSPITAYLSDVFISSECAVGKVFGQEHIGSHKHYTHGHLMKTMPIYDLRKSGRYWVITTRCGVYVLTSFKRTTGRPSLRALIAVADPPDAHF